MFAASNSPRLLCVAALLWAAPLAADPNKAQAGAADPAGAPAPSPGARAPNSATPEKPADPRRIGDAAELDRVVGLYQAGQYDLCASELALLLNPRGDRPFTEKAIISEARLYQVTCSLLGGKEAAAREAMRSLLAENSVMEPPDSMTFPPPVVNLFFEVREEFQSVIHQKEQEQLAELLRASEKARRDAREQKARELELYRLASEEPIVVQNSRALALLPFGVGQYQNGDKNLGHFVLGIEVLLLGTTVVSSVILTNLYRQVAADTGSSSLATLPESERFKFEATQGVLAVSSIALVSATVLGALEAQINFVPERKVGTRKRQLPESLRPKVEVSESGGMLGISGSF